MAFAVASHHNFGKVTVEFFADRDAAQRYYRDASNMIAHMIIGPQGEEISYWGCRRGGRESELRTCWSMLFNNHDVHELCSFLPPVDLENPSSPHAPFLALLNPDSGSKMGRVFLEESQKIAAYKPRFFNIIQVATMPDVRIAFRDMLDRVKRESAMKMAARPSENEDKFRPRLICGGGDGTATFAVSCIFKALHADAGGYIWSDVDLQRFFPALVQMPLGTGNDLAGVLGWGRTINPVDDPIKSRQWMMAALSVDSQIFPLDVWNFASDPCGAFKVCRLAGLDHTRAHRPQFKEAGHGVPFISLLYFSMGVDALIAAQVELNRTESRMQNFVEYLKQGAASFVGSQRNLVNIDGVEIHAPCGYLESDVKQLFPPDNVSRPNFQSVGCMNINSFGGGAVSAVDPAVFSDGLIDVFQIPTLASNVIRAGGKFPTDKVASAEFRVSSNGPGLPPGVYIQYDGEARFLFNPKREDFTIHLKRAMCLPVVIGPIAEKHTPVGALPHSRDSSRVAANSINLPAFRFVGNDDEVALFKSGLEKWVVGDLGSDINASAEDIQALQETSDKHMTGMLCLPSQRIYHDFGAAALNVCARCYGPCYNRGCKYCLLRLCSHCWNYHGNVPIGRWMFGDCLLGPVAEANPVRWSRYDCVASLISELGQVKDTDLSRPIKLQIRYTFDNASSVETMLEAFRIQHGDNAPFGKWMFGDLLLGPCAEANPVRWSKYDCVDNLISELSHLKEADRYRRIYLKLFFGTLGKGYLQNVSDAIKVLEDLRSEIDDAFLANKRIAND